MPPNGFSRTAFCVLVIGITSGVVHAQPTTRYVNATCGNDAWSGLSASCIGPNGPKLTIHAAVSDEDTQDGDTIIVAPGTYSPTERDASGVRRFHFGGHVLTVKCETGDPADCIIDCAVATCVSPPQDECRGFDFFEDHLPPEALLEGFTIRRGCLRAGYGAGIRLKESGPTISKCTIENNRTLSTSRGGGGVGMYGLYQSQLPDDPVFKDCMIRDNWAQTINADIGGYGGGVYATEHARGKFERCTISGNEAYRYGGGLYYNLGAEPEMDDCLIEGNDARQRGGGVYGQSKNDHPRAIIRRSTFLRNTAGSGGAVYVDDYDNELYFANTQFLGNAVVARASEPGWGGGVFVAGRGGQDFVSLVHSANCLFVGNTAVKGAAVYLGNRVLNTAF